MADLTKLGRYKLGKVLGRGAMGVVYEGLDPSLNRRVAIKTILKNAAIDAETAQLYSAQFSREAQAAGRLNHPNIVQVHDFAEEDQVAYLVMEYIQGRELRSYFEANEKFEPAEAVRIMGELLDALDFAHEAGVIHRDIKPANVMLDAQRRVKLADFGVARIQDSERSAAGTMVGTPAFMSPEQISGGKIDRRTDLFSAGVVLYQLLTGEQPFKGEGAWTVAKKIMQDHPPRPSAVVQSVSVAFDAVVHKALAKNPAERYASAREFAEVLRGVLAGRPQPAAAAGTKPPVKAETRASETELEFWRSIQNRDDLDELELYVEQFPDGAYTQLARLKITKLREPLEAARKAQEERVRLEAGEKARREAEERARREAEARAQQAAAERARLEAEAKSGREAAEAEAKARREAAENARREAEQRSAREAEEKARQARALARLKRQQEAAAKAGAAADEDATVAIGGAKAAVTPPAAQKKAFAVPAIAAAAVIVGGVAAYLLLGRTPAPAPVAESPPVRKAATPAAPAVDVEKIRRETEERLRKEFAEKAAVERAAMEKALADKLAAEKAAADKLALAKTAAEKAAAEKAAQKAAAERVAAEKAAADQALQAKAAAESAAAQKAVADKAAADKAAAEKLAAEKAAAAPVTAARKPGLPAVGDRWVYEEKDSDHPERRFQISIVAKSVNGNSVTEEIHRGNGQTVEALHRPFLVVVGAAPGIANFSPYLPAFQDLRPGVHWDDIQSLRLFKCGQTPFTCTISGRVVGRGKVSVKAGTFEAAKVVLQVVVRGGGSGATVIELRYWYAEAVNRYVKYELRTDSMFFSQPRMDMELLSYTPGR